MNEIPCEGCEDRTVSPNCHTNCTAYKQWRGEKYKQGQRMFNDMNALKDQESWLKYQQKGRVRK